MIDWQDKVERPHLVCAASGEPIPPGSTFVSALRFSHGRFERLDYRSEAWDPDAVTDLVSWWRQKRPEPKAETGPRLVNAAVLLAIWADLRESTERTQQCFAWLLTLLLTRSKKLRYLDLVHEGEDSFLVVEERGTRTAYRVRDPKMDEDESQRVERNLEEVFTLPPGVDEPAGGGDDEPADEAT